MPRRPIERVTGAREGAWLGIDVGSSRRKVLAFCLVTSDASGAMRVAFERGAARESESERWPENDAQGFLDLESPRWTAAAVERGVQRILRGSALVTRWVDVAPGAGRGGGMRVAGAGLDAPCGFALAGHARRHTEAHAARAFDTGDAVRFAADLRRFARARNETPLRQRYFWKLVGLATYRGLLALTGRGARDASVDAVTAFCARGLHGARARTAGGVLPPSPAGSVTLREVFPSDTYARAGGAACLLRPEARALLQRIADAPWSFEGDAGSRPTPLMQVRLRAHRRTLRGQLKRGAPLGAMRKIEGDPSWADLWDALACAFVAACEGHGAAMAIGHERARIRAEGAIVTAA